MKFTKQVDFAINDFEEQEDEENLEEIRNSEDFKQFQKEVYAKLEEAQREYERGGELIDHDELFKSLLSSYE